MFYLKHKKLMFFGALMMFIFSIEMSMHNRAIVPILDVLMSNAQASETVLVNGKFYTLDEKKEWAEAVAIEGGNIVYVGAMKGVEAYIDSRGKCHHFQRLCYFGS